MVRSGGLGQAGGARAVRAGAGVSRCRARVGRGVAEHQPRVAVRPAGARGGRRPERCAEPAWSRLAVSVEAGLSGTGTAARESRFGQDQGARVLALTHGRRIAWRSLCVVILGGLLGGDRPSGLICRLARGSWSDAWVGRVGRHMSLVDGQAGGAWIALNRPEGRWARGPSMSSAKVCSMMAWPRCWASAWMRMNGLSVNAAWERQTVNSSPWLSTWVLLRSGMRRTIRRAVTADRVPSNAV